MSINRIIFITVLGFLGSLLTLCSLFANAGVIIGLIGIVFLLAPLILFLCSSKSKRDWDDFKYPMIGSAILSLLLFLFLKSCVMTESPRRNYPYHNATTGEGQYEYGGSREQKEDLKMIDERLEKDPNFR